MPSTSPSFPSSLDLFHIIQYIWAFFLAIGPILGYIPQFIDIKRTRHYQGFSTAICFILLISNILRILSFFLKPYDVFLLAQSIFMIIVQLLMLNLIVKLSARDILPAATSQRQRQHDQTSNPQDNRSLFGTFWAWKSFVEYIIFLSMFTAFFTVIVIVEKLFISSDFVKEAFLYTSTLIESTLCMPQVVTNWKNKGTFGLNKSLVISWIAGDIFKLCYYLYSRARMPFIVCAIIQITVDFVIIYQIIYYSLINVSRENQAKSSLPDSISRPSSTVPLKES